MNAVRIVALSFAAAFGFGALAADIHLAGDSTLCPRKEEDVAKSWGDTLRADLREGCKIHNYAVSGTSTVTFRSIWEKSLIGKVKEGDYVVIQFGHNDMWHTEKKYAQPGVPDRYCTTEQFRENLKRYIADVRAKKGIPLLLSPTSTRNFDEKTGKWLGVRVPKQPYYKIIPEVAKSENVTYIDMNSLGNKVLEREGIEGSKAYFRFISDGKDNVHPSAKGARMLADVFLADIRARKLPVASCFK